MSKFQNVSIVKKANVYFDGKVTSRTVEFSDGTSKTLGLMLAGTYHFNTDLPEIMEVLAGSIRYKLANMDDWQTASAGESFNVPGSSSFDMATDEIADYCCSFIK